jgi:hypothetical protein
VLWRWVVEATFQSIVFTLICVFVTNSYIGYENGRTVSLFVAGVGVNALVVTVVNVKVFSFSTSHFWFTALIQIVSIL